MKIMYLSFNNPLSRPGPYKKETALCSALSAEAAKRGSVFKGVNVSFDTTGGKLPYKDENYTVILAKYPFQGVVEKIKLPVIKSVLKSISYQKLVYKEILDYRPEVLICRYTWIPLFSICGIKKILKKLILITDHQTMEGKEFLSLSLCGGLVKKAVESICFKKKFKTLDAVIAVTSDIAKYEIRRGGENKPFFVLTNGVCLDGYKEKKYRAIKDDKLELLFLASHAFPWNGIDRLLQGMARYSGKTDILLHVVGDMEKEYRGLVLKLRLTDKVVFHGKKFNEELDEIFDTVHIGIGILALHRNGLKVATSLKAREYLARGIPFMIGYEDEDIKEVFPYVLKIPANEEPIDISAVVAFTKKIYAESGQRMTGEIRDYAKKNIDYRGKVKGLMDFIEKLYEVKHGNKYSAANL
jgi:glycosyltransferase involved in cell wall biosynthesis